MTTSENFNDLSGKVISSEELKAELVKVGIDPKYQISPEQFEKKTLELDAQGRAGEIPQEVPAFYERKSFEDLQARALEQPSLSSAMAVFKSGVAPSMMFVDAGVMLKLVDLFEDDSKLRDGFKKAILGCKTKDAGSDFIPMVEGSMEAASKITLKFKAR